MDGEKLETRRNWAFEESCESQPVLLLTLGWNIRVRACPIQISAGPPDFRAPWISTCEPRFPEGQGSTYLLWTFETWWFFFPFWFLLLYFFFLKESFYKLNSFETNVFHSVLFFILLFIGFFWWIERNVRLKIFIIFFFFSVESWRIEIFFLFCFLFFSFWKNHISL